MITKEVYEEQVALSNRLREMYFEIKERKEKAIEYIKTFEGYDDDDVYGVIDILNGNKLGTYEESIEENK